MAVDSIRKHLREASEELASACEEPTAADAEPYLTGVVRLLDYHVEGDTTDPEAHAYPPPGSLDTILGRITEVIDEADEPVAERLRSARSHLLEAKSALDERLNEGRRSSH